MINKVTELKLKVRNKGYSGEVSRKLLKELVSLNGRIGFRGYTKNDIVERSNGVLTYSPTNIVNNKIVNYKNDTYISQDKYKESPEIMVKNNDILFVKTGSTLGKSALVRNLTEPATINPQLIVIKTIHVDSDYLAVYLLTDSIQKQVFQVKIGGAVPTLTETEIGIFVVKLPPLPEQTAIGSLFRTLDDLLASYKDNLTNYQSLKVTMLSKMFPKVGQTVPEIRLDGFEGEWENKILSEVTNITMGQSPKSENYTDNPNDYILVQGNADIKDKQVVPRLWTTEVTKMAEIGDIILTVRAPVGDIGKTDYNVVIGRGVAAIKGNDFIFYTLEKMKMTGFWNKFSTGSTFESISSNDIKEAIIQIPTLEEQKAIGAYFSNLDNLIVAHQEKISQLETLKKKLLQDMFI